MSILKQMAQKSMESSAPDEAVIAAQAAAAAEAEEKETISLSDEIDADVEVICGIADKIDDAVADGNKAAVTSGAIENLVNETIDTYGEGGIDEQGAVLLQSSMESLLKMAGVRIPASMIVPSFESGMTRSDYSTEAEEKKDGIIKRIMSWLADAMQSVIDGVANFFARLFGTSDKLRKYAQRIKAKVGSFNKDGESFEIGLGGEGMFVNGDSATTSLQASVKDFEAFGNKWMNIFGALKEVKVGDVQATFSSAMNATKSMREAGLSSLKNITIVSPFTLTVQNGKDENLPMIGATIKVDANKPEEKKKVKSLTVVEMRSGIDACLKALDVLDAVKGKVDAWAKDAKKVQSWAKEWSRNTLMTSKMHPNAHIRNNAKEQHEALKGVVAAGNLMSQGWSKICPLFLRSIKVHILWVDKSMKSAGKDGELKEVKPEPTSGLAIGYDKDGKKSSGAYGNGKEPDRQGATYQKRKDTSDKAKAK